MTAHDEVPPPEEWKPGGVPLSKVRATADCHCTGVDHEPGCHRRAVIMLLEQRRQGARVIEKSDSENLEDNIRMGREYMSDVAAFRGARTAMGSGISLRDAALLAIAHNTAALLELKLSEDPDRD